MNHLKRCSASPDGALASLMLFFPFTLGMASVRPHTPLPATPPPHHPSPKWSRGCLKTSPGAAGPRLGRRGREGEPGESAVDLSPPRPALALAFPLLWRRGKSQSSPPHWRCQALTVVFICIALVVNWFKMLWK